MMILLCGLLLDNDGCLLGRKANGVADFGYGKSGVLARGRVYSLATL
jgi:hypothetical protein